MKQRILTRGGAGPEPPTRKGNVRHGILAATGHALYGIMERTSTLGTLRRRGCSYMYLVLMSRTLRIELCHGYSMQLAKTALSKIGCCRFCTDMISSLASGESLLCQTAPYNSAGARVSRSATDLVNRNLVRRESRSHSERPHYCLGDDLVARFDSSAIMFLCIFTPIHSSRAPD